MRNRRQQSYTPVVSGVGAPRIVKAVHRGTVNFGSAASTTASLTPGVDVNNSVIRWVGMSNNAVDQFDMWCRVELTNGTTVTVYRYSTLASSSIAAWEVTEYYPGLIKSVQRSTLTLDALPKNLTINSVDWSKAELSLLGWRANTTASPASYQLPYAYPLNATTVQLSSGSSNSQEVGIQIVEWW